MLVSRLHKFFLPLTILFFAGVPFLFSAEQNSQEPAKKSTTQNVGGLLFDFDEGVKVEKGPGGSVYVKSNREFMQEKFLQIDQKLEELERRILTLEEKDAPRAVLASKRRDEESNISRVMVS